LEKFRALHLHKWRGNDDNPGVFLQLLPGSLVFLNPIKQGRTGGRSKTVTWFLQYFYKNRNESV